MLKKGIASFGLATTLALGIAGCSSDSPSIPQSTPSKPPAKNINSALGDPVKIEIPSLKLSDSIVALGLASDGTITPPAHKVEWYTGSVSPGMVGHSIIAGHVTYSGHDVFWTLHEIKPDAEVIIYTSTGKKLTFKVMGEPKSINKDQLQTDQDVWGSTKDKSLVLITCDPNSGWENPQHHKDNTVVWTKLVSQT